MWAVYGLLLVAHHAGRWIAPADPTPDVEGVHRLTLADSTGTAVQIAWREAGPRDGVPLVMVHRVPGDSRGLLPLLEAWDVPVRRIAFDLPGFGGSSHGLADLSARTAARRLLAAVDSMDIDRFHLLGVGQGGSVAIEMLARAPERAESFVLVSATGVEEFELLGNVEINHPLYGAQLAILWFLDAFVPHFGLLDRVPLDLSYARFFYQSDTRPARATLASLELPVLVLHGGGDVLVPPEVAREHSRIVPQSQLEVVPHVGHRLLSERAALVRERIATWIETVEAGEAPRRAEAMPARLTAAQVPIEDIRDFHAHGLTLWLLLVLIVFATFVSEDATSIGVGLLIAQGRLGWLEGFGAVFVGIYFGDLILYGVGHALGMTVVKWPPFRWFLSERDLRRGAEWFGRRGLIAIFLTRFLPGSRLPTYLAVGIVRAGFWRFAGFFFIAVMAWTPVLVGFAAVVGHEALERFERMQRESLFVFLAVLVTLLVLVRVLLPLARWRGRRLARGRWMRWRRWEFWPAWIVYLPVVARAFGWARRYGGLTVPTAANWGMSGAGGVIGESKTEILRALDDGRHVARTCLLSADAMQSRRATAIDFLEREDLGFPVVLKPDAGQRGEGVQIVRSQERLGQLLAQQPIDLVLQEYVPGEEFGVSYVREAGAPHGRITSIVHKRPLLVEGDGRRTLEELILGDPRAVALAPKHLERHADRLEWIPSAGERVVVAELGTHARGSIFVDARSLGTEALEAAIDALSRRFEGFHLGRYDLRVPSIEALRAGRDFKVIELNGLTAEPAHVYDAAIPLVEAQATLVRQWEAAYRIGAAHRDAGHRVWPLRSILAAWWAHRGRRRQHAADRAVGEPSDFTRETPPKE